MSLIFLDS